MRCNCAYVSTPFFILLTITGVNEHQNRATQIFIDTILHYESRILCKQQKILCAHQKNVVKMKFESEQLFCKYKVWNLSMSVILARLNWFIHFWDRRNYVFFFFFHSFFLCFLFFPPGASIDHSKYNGHIFCILYWFKLCLDHSQRLLASKLKANLFWCHSLVQIEMSVWWKMPNRIDRSYNNGWMFMYIDQSLCSLFDLFLCALNDYLCIQIGRFDGYWSYRNSILARFKSEGMNTFLLYFVWPAQIIESTNSKHYQIQSNESRIRISRIFMQRLYGCTVWFQTLVAQSIQIKIEYDFGSELGRLH